MLVEVHDQQQATKLLTQTRMADVDIKVMPLRSLNSSQGVISEPYLANDTDGDLLEGLRSQGVTAIKHTTIKRDDK